jgi:hypothetical protein
MEVIFMKLIQRISILALTVLFCSVNMPIQAGLRKNAISMSFARLPLLGGRATTPQPHAHRQFSSACARSSQSGLPYTFGMPRAHVPIMNQASLKPELYDDPSSLSELIRIRAQKDKAQSDSFFTLPAAISAGAQALRFKPSSKPTPNLSRTQEKAFVDTPAQPKTASKSAVPRKALKRSRFNRTIPAPIYQAIAKRTRTRPGKKITSSQAKATAQTPEIITPAAQPARQAAKPAQIVTLSPDQYSVTLQRPMGSPELMAPVVKPLGTQPSLMIPKPMQTIQPAILAAPLPIHRMGNSINPFVMPARPQVALPAQSQCTALVPQKLAKASVKTPLKLTSAPSFAAYTQAMEEEARFAQLAKKHAAAMRCKALTVRPTNNQLVVHSPSGNLSRPAPFSGYDSNQGQSSTKLSLRAKALIAGATAATLYALTRNTEMNADITKKMNALFDVFALIAQNALKNSRLVNLAQKQLTDSQEQPMAPATQHEHAALLQSMQDEAAKYGLMQVALDAATFPQEMQNAGDGIQIIRAGNLNAQEQQALVTYNRGNNENEVVALLKKVSLNGKPYFIGFVRPELIGQPPLRQTHAQTSQIHNVNNGKKEALAITYAKPAVPGFSGGHGFSITDLGLERQQAEMDQKHAASIPHNPANPVHLDPIVRVVKADGNELLRSIRAQQNLPRKILYPTTFKNMIDGYNTQLKLMRENPSDQFIQRNFDRCKNVFKKIIEDIQKKYGFASLA